MGVAYIVTDDVGVIRVADTMITRKSVISIEALVIVTNASTVTDVQIVIIDMIIGKDSMTIGVDSAIRANKIVVGQAG